MRTVIRVLRFIMSHPLNKGRRLQAIFRFIRWQIGTRLIGEKVVIRWINNAKLAVSRSESGLTGNIYCGLMEFEDMSFLLHYLRADDEFFDIGANAGIYTVLASSVRGCVTHAFEPVPTTFERLCDQVRTNGIETLVDARNCGVGASNDILEFTNSFDCTNRVNTDPNNQDITAVPVIALDDEFTPTVTTAVKIDVEGFEKFVLDGGVNFFLNPNVAVLIVELNESGLMYGVTDSDIDRTIRDCGFKSVSYDPVTRTVCETSKFDRGGNTIFVKDIPAASSRCGSADSVTLHTAGSINL